MQKRTFCENTPVCAIFARTEPSAYVGVFSNKPLGVADQNTAGLAGDNSGKGKK